VSGLASLSIRRPVLATVMSIAIVIFGVIGFSFLGVREYPSVDPAVITVSTMYPGASSDVIESQITEPLEASINSVEGIRELTSVSREGRSTVTVEFDLDVDLERAANDVRDRASQAMRELPPDAEPPTVAKANADNSPIVFLNLSSKQRDLLALTDLAINRFQERLQTIDGVSSVDIWGEKRYAMRFWLDPQRLAAYRLTPLDVQNALQRQNVELPSGRIEGTTTELTVRTTGRLSTPGEFERMILRQDGSRIVRLRDVATVQLGAENERSILKRDGVPMVGVVLRAQPGANHINIVDEFYERVEQIRRDLPPDVELGIGFDNTRYIRRSITEVAETIALALALVVLIIFAFLRDGRTTLVPVMAIPVSLIGAFFVMYVADFSINVLTLLAIVLAIGLVVDDAIVVLENIYAKIEAGMDPAEAGEQGTREIFFAVVATTVALAVVFLPILFLTGLTGRLFREFGVTLAGAVIISSFVALTLTPMLAVRLLKRHEKQSWLYRVTEPFFVRMNGAYARSLDSFLRRRWLGVAVLGGAAALAVVMYRTLPSELAPIEDRGQLRIMATAPEGATFEYMDAYVDRLVGMVGDQAPEEAMISVTSPGFSASGSVNSGFVMVMLQDAAEREEPQQSVAQRLTREVRRLSGARSFVSEPPTISAGGGGFGGLPLQYVLQAPTIEQLREVLPRFMEEARQAPEFAFVDVNLKFDRPELQVEIDRDRAQSLGVSVLDVSRTLQLALSGQRYGYFIRDGRQYEVIGQVGRQDRDQPLDLGALYVRSASGEPVAVGNLVRVTETSAPPQLFRFNRYISATVSASLAPGVAMGDGIAAMDRIGDHVLPETFQTALNGEAQDFAEGSSSLLFVFLLALVLIYLVLAAQFESFRDPLVILLTVPLALTGALVSLWYFHQTLNIFSQIGMIMLIGLVTKNGILIVEFANQRRDAGLRVQDAVMDAAAARFRPILMTSLSTVLGILPIALALGAGAESRVPMGIAVVGGMVIGTALTLYVVPAMYSYLATPQVGTARSVHIPGIAAVPADPPSDPQIPVGAAAQGGRGL
jgi:multidrug efflux pump